MLSSLFRVKKNLTDNKEGSPPAATASSSGNNTTTTLTTHRTISLNELRSLPRTIITAAAAAAGSQPQQVTLLTTSTSNNSSGTGNNNNDSSQATSTIITIKQESLANLQFVDSTTFLTSNAPHSPSSQMVNPNLVQCSTSSATTTTSPGELNSFSFYKKTKIH